MGAPTAPAAATGTASMIEDEARQWRELLRERSEAALRRRAARAAARREAARRRAHGLIDQQAACLARGRPGSLFAPDLDCTQ